MIQGRAESSSAKGDGTVSPRRRATKGTSGRAGFRAWKALYLNGLTLTLSMNPRSELRVLKDWKDLGLNSLTLTLTPGRTSAWHHSPGENSFPRIGNMVALDLTRFRDSMRDNRFGEFSPPRRGRIGFRVLAMTRRWICEGFMGGRDATGTRGNADRVRRNAATPSGCWLAAFT
jgi:hypothetical protein